MPPKPIRRPSSRDAMAMLRARREATGLVQMNLWIRADDTEGFRAAVRPFRQRAKEAEGRGRPVRLEAPAPAPQAASTTCTVRFGHLVPSAMERGRMKAAGWSYDRAGFVWSITWPGGAGEAETRFLEEMRGRYEAEVVVG